MARTVIDIDDKALVKAKKALGTKTKVETVNTALREIAQRQKRVEAVEGIAKLMPTHDDYLREQTDHAD